MGAAGRESKHAWSEALPVSLRELFADVPAEPEWWWHGFGARGTLVELDGAAKRAGKTTFVAHLVRAVLDGRPFLERVTRRTRVVYLSEQPVASLRASFAPAGLVDREDLRILTWSEAAGRPWPEVVGAAIAACEQDGAGLLVVDTLPQWAGLRGESENDAGAALEAIAPLQAAAGRGLAVLVVRHDRKGGGEVGESARGSTAFGGAVDVILQLRRGGQEERSTVRYLSALSRFPDTPAELVIELLPGPGIHSGGAAGMNYAVLGDVTAYTATEGKQHVLVALGDQELRRSEIEAATGISGERLTALLGELVAAGYLERAGRGVKGDPQRFRRIVSIHSGAPPHYVRGAVPNGIEPAPAGVDDEASVARALFAPVPGNGADAHRIACRDYGLRDPRAVSPVWSDGQTEQTVQTAHADVPARTPEDMHHSYAVSPVSTIRASASTGYRSSAVCPVPPVSPDELGAHRTTVAADGIPTPPTEPPDLFVLPPEPPCFADPDDYRAHASDHYRFGDGWGCRRCEAAEVVA